MWRSLGGVSAWLLYLESRDSVRCNCVWILPLQHARQHAEGHLAVNLPLSISLLPLSYHRDLQIHKTLKCNMFTGEKRPRAMGSDEAILASKIPRLEDSRRRSTPDDIIPCRDNPNFDLPVLTTCYSKMTSALYMDYFVPFLLEFLATLPPASLSSTTLD